MRHPCGFQGCGSRGFLIFRGVSHIVLAFGAVDPDPLKELGSNPASG